MSVTAVTECHSRLGEGPYWEEATQSLLHVDIFGKEVHKWDSQTQKEDVVKLDDQVSFVIPCRTGGYAVGVLRTLARLDWETGSLQTLAKFEPGTKNCLNDAKCDARGRLFVGTMSMVMSSDSGFSTPEAGAFYSIDSDLTVTQRLDKISISNGLDWTNDNTVMYYTDTLTYSVEAFDYEISTGGISNRRTVIKFPHLDIGGQGLPDGMTIDIQGKLWVACFSGGKVIRVDPEKGVIIQEVKLPTSNITSCTFGGRNLDELYVTSAAIRLTDEQTLQQPTAGCVFRVTGLGVKGRLPNVFDI